MLLVISILQSRYAPQPSVNHNESEVQPFFFHEPFGYKMKSEKSANHEKCFQKYGTFEVAHPLVVN